MSKVSVSPLVLGIGTFVAVSSGSTVLADDLDEALTMTALDESLFTITGAHGGDGECGEDDKEGKDGEEGKCGEGECGEGEHKGEGDDEGKCGEGQCGEGDEESSEEEGA